ncbi:MAG: hypothetical protein HY905_28230 [Deltaproteobacteria bacterium]|nr:hypothetical protein [Deltaproteobacteria bacterium]
MTAYRISMSKCPICNERKGKRQCRVRNAPICSPCCAAIRARESCRDCGFYVAPTRDYDRLPRYSTREMEDVEGLEAMSFPIEASVCLVDRERGYTLSDEQAIAMFELLLDIYAFGGTRQLLADRIHALGCEEVVEIVERELAGRPRDEIAKVLGAVRFVARRRTRGGREHMRVLQEFCGAFVRTGIGLRRYPDGSELAVGEIDGADELRPVERAIEGFTGGTAIPHEEAPRCGLCGKTGNLTKTECCGRWICDDEDQYEMFSYARNSCSRNHRRLTLCGQHHAEGHAGRWQDCGRCPESSLGTEMFVWFGTNEYNFEKLPNPPRFKPTHCAGCGRVIRLGEDGFSMQEERYYCQRCSTARIEGLARNRHGR